MKCRRTVVALIGGILVSAVAHAHQDKLLYVTPWGSIWGLPGEYKPAKLLVGFTERIAGPRVSSVEVVLGRRRLVLPTCFTDELPSARRDDVVVGASWHHDERELPHYLWVAFFESSDNERWAHPAPYRVLFDLRTGDVLEVTPSRLASCVAEQLDGD